MADGQDYYDIQAEPKGTGRDRKVNEATVHTIAFSDGDHLAPQRDQRPANPKRGRSPQERSGGNEGDSEESGLDPVEKDWLADLRIAHSDFQLIHFVVAQNGITAWGCYQQALREYFARRDELFKIQKTGPFGLRHWEELAREIKTLAKLCEWYRKQLPNPLTPEVKAELEADLAYRRLSRQVKCELIAEKRLSLATLMAIGACPPRMRKRLYDEAVVATRNNPIDFLCDEHMTVKGVKHPESIEDLTTRLIDE